MQISHKELSVSFRFTYPVISVHSLQQLTFSLEDSFSLCYRAVTGCSGGHVTRRCQISKTMRLGAMTNGFDCVQRSALPPNSHKLISCHTIRYKKHFDTCHFELGIHWNTSINSKLIYCGVSNKKQLPYVELPTRQYRAKQYFRFSLFTMGQVRLG